VVRGARACRADGSVRGGRVVWLRVRRGVRSPWVSAMRGERHARERRERGRLGLAACGGCAASWRMRSPWVSAMRGVMQTSGCARAERWPRRSHGQVRVRVARGARPCRDARCAGVPRRAGGRVARRRAERARGASGSRGAERSEGAGHGAAWRVARGCRHTWSGAVEAGEMGEDRADAWGPQGREKVGEGVQARVLLLLLFN